VPGHYIIMADVVGSSGAPARPLIRTFRSLVKRANTRFADEILSPVTITLGDEFQGVVRSLPAGLRLLLWLEEEKLRAAFRFQLRYVLHLGAIETPLNPDYAHGMLGSGLSHARRQLEELKKSHLRFLVETGGARDKALNLAFRLYEDVYDSWSSEDQEVVALFVKLRDYKKVAARLGVNPSSTFRRRRTLRLAAYLNAKALIECLATL
jgi:hypothetical protein